MKNIVLLGVLVLVVPNLGHPSEVSKKMPLVKPHFSPKELPYFQQTLRLVEEKSWFHLFHQLYDFEISEIYSKKKHGSEKEFRKALVKTFNQEPKLKAIRSEIVFRHWLEKVNGGGDYDDSCDDSSETPLSRRSDPVFQSLKKLRPGISKDVYIEGFGGEGFYAQFLSKLGDGDNGTIQLPLGLGGWTKFCFSKKAFWLTQIGEQWASMLVDRKQSIDRVFSKRKVLLEDLVDLGNWYIVHASNGGSLRLNPKTTRLVVRKGNYHLTDDASQISSLVFDGGTRTVTEFNWHLED